MRSRLDSSTSAPPVHPTPHHSHRNTAAGPEINDVECRPPDAAVRLVRPGAHRRALRAADSARSGSAERRFRSRATAKDASDLLRLEPLTSAHRLGQGDEFGRLAQTVRGHIAVDRLVLARSHEVGLVPDSGACALADASPVVAPHLEVWIVSVLGECLQVLEGSPVLNDGEARRLVAEQPFPGCSVRYLSMWFMPRRPPRSTRPLKAWSFELMRAPMMKTTKSPSISAVHRPCRTSATAPPCW